MCRCAHVDMVGVRPVEVAAEKKRDALPGMENRHLGLMFVFC